MLYYYIIQGIVEIAGACNEKSLQQQGHSVFMRVVIIQVINAFAIPIVLDFGNSATAFTIGLIIVSLIIEITFLVYIKKSYIVLNEKVITNEEKTDYIFDKKSIFKKLIITIACGGVFCIGGFIYISNAYLFTPFNYPGILQSELSLDYSNFTKPLNFVDCGVCEGSDITWFTIEGKNNINNVTKKFVVKIADTMSNSTVTGNIVFKNMNDYFDNKRYDITVQTKDKGNVFYVYIYSNKILEVNGKNYLLDEKAYDELERFIKENFTVKIN